MTVHIGNKKLATAHYKHILTTQSETHPIHYKLNNAHYQLDIKKHVVQLRHYIITTTNYTSYIKAVHHNVHTNRLHILNQALHTKQYTFLPSIHTLNTITNYTQTTYPELHNKTKHYQPHTTHLELFTLHTPNC